MRMRVLTMALAAGLAATALAHPDPSRAADEEPRDVCVRVADVSGWTVIDDRTIELRVGAGRRFRAELTPLAESFSLGSRPRIGLTGDSLGYLCEHRGRVVVDGRALRVRQMAPAETTAAAGKP